QGQSIPTISNITPSTVSPGDTITITGTSFCTRRPQQTSVTFADAIKGTVLSLSATSIQAQVPAGAVSGSVVVRSCRQTSTGYPITVGSVVTPPTVTPPTATGVFGPSSTLQLDKTIVTSGQTLYAIVTYTNSSSSAVTINNLVIASRPPVSTKAGGPYLDLSPIVSVTTVQPGATIQLSASRAFTTSDPPGMWSAYSTWQDSALVWYDDGPTLNFTVSVSSTPTPSTTPV